MRILIIGGTVFVGPAVVEAALAKGCTVAVFNRGRSNPVRDPRVETIAGDRRQDLGRLAGRSWDAVIDTCGYLPEDVEASARVIETGSYVFISSVMVYRDLGLSGSTEDSALVAPAEPAVRRLDASTLGALKRGAERTLERLRPSAHLTLRCALLVGPGDLSSARRPEGGVSYDEFAGRFPYWVLRFARGGRVLVPGPPDAPFQVLDVRDLAAWIIELVLEGRTGVLNVAGQPGQTWADLTAACRAAAQPMATTTVWVHERFLKAHGVRNFTELPMWAAERQGWGVCTIDPVAAVRAGLRWRSLSSTVRDTLAWALKEPSSALGPSSLSMNATREHSLLETWDSTAAPGLREADWAPFLAAAARTLGSSVALVEEIRDRGYAHNLRGIIAAAGRRHFAKCAVDDLTEAWLRIEHLVYQNLRAPFLPRVIGWTEGQRPMLLLEDLSHAFWPPPFSSEIIARVLGTMAEVAASEPPAGLPTLVSLDSWTRSWSTVEADARAFLSTGVVDERWLTQALPTLRNAADPALLSGHSLLHMDVRSDNMCLDRERVVLLDWSWAAIGNPVIDVAFWLPSLRLDGGPRPSDVIAVDPGIASLVAGHFAAVAGLPEIPTAPRVRTVQKAQLKVALLWAAELLGLPTPPS